MKFATYRLGDAVKVGLVDAEGGRLFDLDAAARRAGAPSAPFASMLALVDSDEAGLDLARSLVERRGGGADLWRALGQVELMAPLPEPRQMRDAMSFALHIRQAARGSRALQAMRSGGPGAFEAVDGGTARGARGGLSRSSDILHHQPPHRRRAGRDGSLAALQQGDGLRTRGRDRDRRSRADIPAREAGAHIFGYTIFNDFSARDRQAVEMAGRLGPAKGKSFDGSNVLGPWIVTPDELGDPQSLSVAVRVNGDLRATGNTAGMLFSFEEILAYASQGETIYSGEFFGSGTVGNCCGLETGRFLDDGDVIELEVERVGVLRNAVVRQPAL